MVKVFVLVVIRMLGSDNPFTFFVLPLGDSQTMELPTVIEPQVTIGEGNCLPVSTSPSMRAFSKSSFKVPSALIEAFIGGIPLKVIADLDERVLSNSGLVVQFEPGFFLPPQLLAGPHGCDSP